MYIVLLLYMSSLYLCKLVMRNKDIAIIVGYYTRTSKDIKGKLQTMNNLEPKYNCQCHPSSSVRK